MASEQDDNYLDFKGLKIVWAKIKEIFATKKEVQTTNENIEKLKPMIYAGL